MFVESRCSSLHTGALTAYAYEMAPEKGATAKKKAAKKR